MHVPLEITPIVEGQYRSAVFAGTRFAVWQIVYDLEHGITEAELLQACPSLTQAHLDAAKAYAAAHEDEIRGEIAEQTGDQPARIVKTPGTCGGRARLDGRRIAVWHIVGDRARGQTDENLIADFDLTLHQLRAIDAYHATHADEIAQDTRENEDG